MNDTWYIEVNGLLYGPYLTVQLIQMAQNNQLSLQTLVKSAQTGVYYKVQDIVAPPQQTAAVPSYPAPGVLPNMPQPGIQLTQPNVQNPQQGMPVAAPQVQPFVAATQVQPVQQIQQIQQVQPLQQVQVALQNQAIPNAAPSQGLPVTPASQLQQEETPPLVRPVMKPEVEADKKSEAEKQPGITSTMRDWIDRSNIENGKIVCPHCWGLCSLETILFISSHPELVGDPLLGEDAATRFLPKYFTAKGTAFDERSMECSDMACPHCHLKIPNAVIDLPSSFFSIVGAPASGKSYFLTSMVWQLRKSLPKYFNFSFFDTDPAFNMVLNNYERILFLNSNQQEYVALPKTELQGRDFSNQIVIDKINIDLPRPFVFTLSPQPTNPLYGDSERKLERSLVLYDNAGEHFETGRDSIVNLATIHLVHSDGIIFLYDPLKDIRLRQGCSADDPQISKNTANVTNQITIFTEMIARIHKHSNLKANEKYDKPLIVVIPKYDAWKESFPLDLKKMDIIAYDDEVTPYLNMDAVCAVSFCLRKYLFQVAPEIVGLAEGFSERVYFIPSSALGRMPEFDEEKSLIGIKPDHISPIWAEVPFLLQLHLNKLLPAVCGVDDKVPYINQYKFNRGYIMFSFPETTEHHTLPSFYCGKTVYCDTTKTFYRLPDYPIEETPGSCTENIELPDQDFWTK